MIARAQWLRSALAAVLFLGSVASAATAAVTVVNRDDKDYKLTIVEDNGARTTDHTLKPSQVLEGVCEQGCLMRVNDSEEDEYELQAGDKVSIEEGYLYYDEPESSQQGSAPAAAPPATTPPAAAPPAAAPPATAPPAPSAVPK